MSGIQSVLHETRIFNPSDEFVRQANVSGMASYQALCKAAEQDYAGYWAKLARDMGVPASTIVVQTMSNTTQEESVRIGRAFAIPAAGFLAVANAPLSEKQKALLDRAVSRAIRDYGTALRQLGDA